MEKVYDYKFGDKYTKIYDMDEIVDVLGFVDILQNNNIQIINVSLTEGVELEMQSVSGNLYKLDEFIQAYDYLRSMGSELCYNFNCSYNEAPLRIRLGENSKTVTLISAIDSIELEDLIKKKSYS